MVSVKGIVKFFVMIFLVIIGVFVVKKVFTKFNVPVISGMVQEV